MQGRRKMKMSGGGKTYPKTFVQVYLLAAKLMTVILEYSYLSNKILMTVLLEYIDLGW